MTPGPAPIQPDASATPPLTDLMDLRPWLRGVPDFPKPGIVFKDITPLLLDARAFSRSLDALAEACARYAPTHIAGVESRGFLFGAPVAERLGCGFVPVRKPGKLPWKTFAENYDLEYGTDTLEVHVDASSPGERIVLLDDLLATGGTAAAAVRLLRRTGAEVMAFGCAVELAALGGRARLHGVEVFSLTRVDD